MGKLINHDKAIEYLDSIADPIVRSLIEYGYGKIFVEDLTKGLEGDFDLLFSSGLWKRFCVTASGWPRPLLDRWKVHSRGIRLTVRPCQRSARGPQSLANTSKPVGGRNPMRGHQRTHPIVVRDVE